jgi:dimethylamine/trimethylamine dehydrogenase
LYQEVCADGNALSEAGIKGVYRIGDCLSPRSQVADAIFDGHRLAREIDSPDPAVHKPYIRERRLIGSTDRDYDQVLTRGTQ